MSDWRVAVLRCCTAFVAGLLACLFWPGEACAQTTEKPDLTRQPTLYVVGYAHLDTEWRWEYPQVSKRCQRCHRCHNPWRPTPSTILCARYRCKRRPAPTPVPQTS